MEKLTKNISEIVENSANTINEKINGINFLELLKVNLIEKIQPLIDTKNLKIEDKNIYEFNIIRKDSNIKILITYFTNSFFINKKNIQNDTLFIVFNEFANFDLYENKKKFTSILLYKNTGMTLPKGVVINSKFNKNAFLLEIINKDIEQTLTN